MKNDYSEMQDNEAGTQTEAENYVSCVSREEEQHL